MGLSKQEYETAVDSLTDDELDDDESNFKSPLIFKIQLSIIYFVLFFGRLYAVGYLIVGFRHFVQPSRVVCAILAVLVVAAWLVLGRWSLKQLWALYSRCRCRVALLN